MGCYFVNFGQIEERYGDLYLSLVLEKRIATADPTITDPKSKNDMQMELTT